MTSRTYRGHLDWILWCFYFDVSWQSNEYFRVCGFWSSEIFRKNFIRFATVSVSSKINNYRKNSSFAKIWEKEKSVLIKMLVCSATQSLKWQFGKFKNRVSQVFDYYESVIFQNSNMCFSHPIMTHFMFVQYFIYLIFIIIRTTPECLYSQHVDHIWQHSHQRLAEGD